MSITADMAIETLRNSAAPEKAEAVNARSGTADALGVPPQTLEDLARNWRQDVALPDRLELARELWQMGALEGRLMAAKLLTQARIQDDAAIWEQICTWVSEAGNWAEIDALSAAGARRIVTDLSRMEKVHALAQSERVLDRRAALGLSLPLAKRAHPTDEELSAIDDVLFWLTYALQDADKDVSRMADSWLKSLGKHDRKRASMVRRVVQSRTNDA